MRVVVDTNVVAYYLLKTEPFSAEAAALWSRVRKPRCPLATFDAGLLGKFPDTARRPAEIVRPKRRAASSPKSAGS